MRAVVLFLVLGLALAQGYLVGRVLEVDPLSGTARVQVGAEVREALLPQGGGGFAPGMRAVLYEEGGRLYLTEPDRMPTLLALFALFALLAALLARGKGVRGLLGTFLSLLVLVLWVVPHLAQGGNPLLYALLGSLGVLLLTVYLVHGVNRKTTAAFLGTLLSAFVVLLLALFFVRALGFTGLASEEALLLHQWGGVDLLALYLAGVVVGALGALTDVTVTQAAVVQALAHADPKAPFRLLYRRAMEVGYDHMGSLVNTLVLAYSAGSLPLFLLLTKDPTPWRFLLNTEPFAAEIVAMLLGSLGLLLAVPLTTLVAAWAFRGGRGGAPDHPHPH
ncbi:YibE/F-like protein [Thermus oshimai JL-2]|uniref:YibE/F-like protein n=1 Tax=Thermus oshimai JL-2 TaxID=751945 RepID=K7R4N1_THEOS|nr:YibE/F family protein [Thermus oshimai]AFV75864.1 YibE/F-like protein [Thermus oshimai JL-2]